MSILSNPAVHKIKHAAALSLGAACTALLTVQQAAAQDLMMPGEEEKYPYPETINELPLIREPLPWWAWGLIGLTAAGALALLLWLIFRRRPARPARLPDPKKMALHKLQSLRDEVEKIGAPEAAHQVSLIIREYQQGVYQVPAPYRTSEELYQTGPRQTHEHARQRFGKIADFLDKLAFAPQPSSTFEVKKLIEEAIITVENNTPPPLMLLGIPGAGAARPPVQPPPLPVAAVAEAEAISASDTVSHTEAGRPARTASNEAGAS